MRLKQLRERASSEQTVKRMRDNPYLEIWDVDYYSTSDEEDDDDESKSSEDEKSSNDSEVDGNSQDEQTAQAVKLSRETLTDSQSTNEERKGAA